MHRPRFVLQAAAATSLIASLVVGMSGAPAEAAAAGSSNLPGKSVPVRAGVGRQAQPSQTDGPGVTGFPKAVLPWACKKVCV